MTILVIAEHDHVSVKSATLNTIAAAKKIGGDIDVLVAGNDCAAAAQAAAMIDGVARVRVADATHYADQSAENVAALVVAHAGGYSHILAPATTFGKNLLPRVAALLDVAQISDIVAVESARHLRPTDLRRQCAGYRQIPRRGEGNHGAQHRFRRRPAQGGVATVEALPAGADLGLSKLNGRELTKSARPELGDAKIIVSGGRGLGNGENYHRLLDPLADKLGAALGASRAAVDAGFVPNDYQVGQTGKIVAPELYIAIGISGAIQHLAGMKDSKVIVAINKDTDAPIFQVADYGLVADLFEAVPEITGLLSLKPADPLRRTQR